MIPIGKTKPSIQFPVGTTIEDPMMVAKILKKADSARVGDCYYVKVLQWKIELSEGIKQHLAAPDEIWITVLEENIHNIKIVSNE